MYLWYAMKEKLYRKTIIIPSYNMVSKLDHLLFSKILHSWLEVYLETTDFKQLVMVHFSATKMKYGKMDFSTTSTAVLVRAPVYTWPLLLPWWLIIRVMYLLWQEISAGWSVLMFMMVDIFYDDVMCYSLICIYSHTYNYNFKMVNLNSFIVVVM